MIMTRNSVPGFTRSALLCERLCSSWSKLLGILFLFVVSTAGVVAETRVVQGTWRSDQIDESGSSTPVAIYGKGGGDEITGSAFNDEIEGGSGNDSVSAGGGDDILRVVGNDNGRDFVNGGDGYDRILGSVGDDTIGHVHTGTGDSRPRAPHPLPPVCGGQRSARARLAGPSPAYAGAGRSAWL